MSNRELIAEAAAAEREARIAYRFAERVDTRDTWLSAAYAAKAAEMAADRAGLPEIVKASQQAGKEAFSRANSL